MKKKILFIDDDLEILESVKIFLESENFDVETDDRGNSIDELSDRLIKPDLILMDMLISGNDGRDLTKKVKQNEKLKNIPIIMITAHPAAAKTPTAWGNDDFMEKPFDIYKLIEKINKLL